MTVDGSPCARRLTAATRAPNEAVRDASTGAASVSEEVDAGVCGVGVIPDRCETQTTTSSSFGEVELLYVLTQLNQGTFGGWESQPPAPST